MGFFALKISDPAATDTVQAIKESSQDFVIQQLNQLESDLKVGSFVFMQLGGWIVSWDKGLIGLAEITEAPFDKGYDPDSKKNFRIRLKMDLVLSEVIKREDFRFYADAYDAGGIGPTTKGEQNQAIKAITDKQAQAILRVMAENQPEMADSIKAIFGAEFSDGIFGKMTCLVEKTLSYDEVIALKEIDLEDSDIEEIESEEQEMDETEEKNKALFRYWLTRQVKPEGDSDAGQPYSANSISQYVSNITNTPLCTKPEKSLFYTTEIAEAKKTLGEVESGEKKNNTQRSAIRKYIQYLSSLNSDEINLNYHTKIESNRERNRIVFGAPGTGKSYALKHDTEEFLKGTSGTMERVTFHPDYTYSQFVGTYKPVSEGGAIKYEFVPGPFMRVFVDAVKSGMTETPQSHVLVIEEINRAKVAAVFGAVFQLLDRDDDGVSEYDIQTSEDIRKYLAKELGGKPSNYSRMRIPNNMFIWATMNSADQGVFPMDTAFKRRWDFEYIGIDDNENSLPKMKEPLVIGETKIFWNPFRKAINDFLSSDKCKVNEDKLMGPFFVSGSVIEKGRDSLLEAIKSKVLMYLFEDAGRSKRQLIFPRHSRYSDIKNAFENEGMGVFNQGIIDGYKKYCPEGATNANNEAEKVEASTQAVHDNQSNNAE